MRRTRGFRRNRGNRKFRKRGGLWLPTLGTNWDNEGTNYWESSSNFITPGVFPNKAGGTVSEVWPIIPDFTFLQSEVTGTAADRAASLHDRASGNEWQLDSIVGSVFVNCQEGGAEIAENEWPYIQVTAGLFVSRSEEGADATPDLFSDEYDPIAVDNIQNPWIWRRTWILANPVGIAVLRDDFPISNSAYGELGAGTVIKTKTKRRIRREHRLFATVSAIGWRGNTVTISADVDQPNARGLFDLRVYGRIITNPRGGGSTF